MGRWNSARRAGGGGPGANDPPLPSQWDLYTDGDPTVNCWDNGKGYTHYRARYYEVEGVYEVTANTPVGDPVSLSVGGPLAFAAVQYVTIGGVALSPYSGEKRWDLP